LPTWTNDDCFDLLCWYTKFERHYRKGIGNNLSLTNTNVLVDEITFSLMAYKLKHFELSFLLIMPFKVEQDSRNISRATTTFTNIKRHCKAFSQQSGLFLEGEERRILIDGLCNRIMLGFGWSNKQSKNKIYRYRLVMILNDPKLIIDSNIHVHHIDGIQKILDSNNDYLNDTVRNLKLLPADEHSIEHGYFGDDKFIEM
jgi:hypothetical protein